MSITLNEIIEQPSAITEALKDVEKKSDAILNLFRKKFDSVIFTGCGTSYYLALSASSVFKEIVKRRSVALPSSEIFLYPSELFGKTLVVPISRSGETSETVLATNFAKETKKSKILAISCYEESKLVKKSDLAIVSPKGKEKSIVMTKSFSSMLVATQAVSAIVSENEHFFGELKKIPRINEKIIKKYRSLAKEIGEDQSIEKFVFLGQGPFYGIACEAMLKMKEMAITWSEAYHSLESRHGPKSIIDEKTLVTILLSDSAQKYEVDLIKEIRDFGTKVLTVCEEEVAESDYTVAIESQLGEFARMPAYMPFLQLMGYYKALSKGLNPDSPKKLTQVVKL